MREHPRPLARCIMRLTVVFSAIGGKAMIATLAILGLLLIPVECSVAMGPHTLFLSADAVAALQNDAPPTASSHAAHGVQNSLARDAATAGAASSAHPQHAAPEPNLSAANRGVAQDLVKDTAEADASGGNAWTSGAPARPAGISADAVVTLDLPGDQPQARHEIGRTSSRFTYAMPPDRLPAAPEPPPP